MIFATSGQPGSFAISQAGRKQLISVSTAAAIASVLLALSADAARSHHSHGASLVGSVHAYSRGRPRTSTRGDPTASLPFVVIADLDEASKDTNETKLSFFSYLQHGSLDIWTSAGDSEGEADSYEIALNWGEQERATPSINDAGSGFELSELAWYQNKLLKVDDRTGVLFELTGFEDDAPLRAILQDIVMEGDGRSGKGQKHEWATVKDDELYLGSHSRTRMAWSTTHASGLRWRHVDWSANYERVREALGVSDPGFEAFNETLDDRLGANLLVIASEDFDEIDVVEFGEEVSPERGFTSFKFVPESDDSVIKAIKSVELEEEQNAFVTVLDIDGNVLLDDVEIPGDSKYEGLVFAPL